MSAYHFLSYSTTDGLEFALRLADALRAGPPEIPVWIDKRDLKAGEDWDQQIVEAIRSCESLLFVMTAGSVEDRSVTRQEWLRALKYKKPVIPLLAHPQAEMPFLLEPRQYIDFTAGFDSALARLRRRLEELASPQGQLHLLEERLADARRDLGRLASPVEQQRTRAEIGLLERQIADQQRLVHNPQSALRQAQQNIQLEIERQRQPQPPAPAALRKRIINTPPAIAPVYFQNRLRETMLIADFLKDPALRLAMVVGRAGIGKTSMTCRLLKSLEEGRLPDDLGPLDVDGIVYLSGRSSRGLRLPYLYAGLCRLLPEQVAGQLDALYKMPQSSTQTKMEALLAEFPAGRTLLLLDNFEEVVDPQTQELRDAELDEALRALLELPQHAVKVILTTRIAPRSLELLERGRQFRLNLDEGLPSPYAEKILAAMDVDGKVGLRDAPAELLDEARRRTLGFPRALEALFAILSADRYTSLQEVLQDVHRLLPDSVVETLVGEAYDRLDGQAQQVMQALAVFKRPVPPAAVDFLLQPYQPGLQSAPTLNRLVNMQFVRKEGSRYYLHPVDREYALAQVPSGSLGDLSHAPGDPVQWNGPITFSQAALFRRAAAYYRQVRKPQESWQTLDDLAPLLAEFEMLYAAGDWDAAGQVLMEASPGYLFAWGYYPQVREVHALLQGKLVDPRLGMQNAGLLADAQHVLGDYRAAIDLYGEAIRQAQDLGELSEQGRYLGSLGLTLARIGQADSAIQNLEQALAIARQSEDRQAAGRHLGSLSLIYHDLGQTLQAKEYLHQALAIAWATRDRFGEERQMGTLALMYASLGQAREAAVLLQQALAIARQVGDRPGEGQHLANLAEVLIDEGDYLEAARFARQSLEIADAIHSSLIHSFAYGYLAQAYLLLGDLVEARQAIENARRYDEPLNNCQVLAWQGLIALRQDDREAARQAFSAGVECAGALLATNPHNHRMLNTQGLAYSGLGLALREPAGESQLQAAVVAYRAARRFNRDPGMVRRCLQSLDALAQAHPQGKELLSEVYAAASAEGLS